MDVRTAGHAGSHFIWDNTWLSQPGDQHFDPAWWRERDMVTGQASGRGTAYFLNTPNGAWVLRHFRRGGLVSKLVHDSYLWRGAARSRPFLEWRLLGEMTRLGLPVPVPVAARVVRSGCAYKADLLTVCVPGAQTLDEALRSRVMEAADWHTLGQVIARFHAAGVWHADLNAKNILVDGDRRFTLIDFDHSRLRKPGRWASRNLARLRRSLEKQQARHLEYHFAEADWGALLSGYLRANAPSTPLPEKASLD